MNWTEAISAHYKRNWGELGEPCPFASGPIHELPQGFQVMSFPPRQGRSLWTYATYGMSRADDVEPLELHLFSPVADNGIVELLFAVAHFHRTGSKLNLWHTVNFGRPWLGNSLCTHGLVSLPYLDGPDLENLHGPLGTIKFYWLIPITREELALKKKSGIEALEARFEEAAFDYSDPARKSVV